MIGRRLGLAVVVGTFAVGATLSACGPRTVEAVGGETNWLVLCSDDGDCSEGSCYCGVCTRACDAASDCIDPHAGVCRSSATLEACASEPPGTSTAPAGVCLPSCTGAAQCGDRFSCQESACVPDSAGTSAPVAPGASETPGVPGSTGVGSVVGDPDAGSAMPPTSMESMTDAGVRAPTVGTVTLVGEAEGALGMTNAIVGDLDADGYDDFLVMDAGNTGPLRPRDDVRGAAYLFYGRPSFEATLEATAADAIFRGAAELACALGDLNDDGFDDFAFTSGAGVHVVFGAAQRTTGDRVATEEGVLLTVDGVIDNAERSHTFAVNPAGDVDGDGRTDLIVQVGVGLDGLGVVTTFLVSGAAIGMSGRIELAVTGAAMALELGASSVGGAGAGDVDGDGYGDLLVNFNDGLGSRGGLLYGGAGFFDQVHTYAESAASWAHELIWTTLGTAGDLDGDGYDDFVASDSTIAGIYYGGSTRRQGTLALADADFLIEAESPEAYLVSIAFGDLDGNGFRDVVVGDPHQPKNGSQAGALYAVRAQGRLAGTLQLGADQALRYGEGDSAPDGGLPGPDSLFAEDLGYGTASGGDVNGDGLDDILVGAPGHLWGDAFGGATHLIFGSGQN